MGFKRVLTGFCAVVATVVACGGSDVTGTDFCSVNETVGAFADAVFVVAPETIAEQVPQFSESLTELSDAAPVEVEVEVEAMVEAFRGFLDAFEQIGYDSSQAADPEFQAAAAALFQPGGSTVDEWVNENCDAKGFFGGELVPPP
jgi:hypothetical protein